jgi:hypothetical protein
MVIALLLHAVGSPAHAACTDPRCTDAASIDSAQALLESTCGCEEPGQTHAKYTRCVKNSLKLPSVMSLLPEKHCRALVLRCERASICGRPNAAVCCTLRKNGSVKASIVGSPAACRKGTACGAALGLFTTSDACSADATCAGVATTSTTTTTVAGVSTTSIPSGGPTTTLPPSSVPNVSLTGCATAGYVAPLTIGSQDFAVVVDSGSTTLAVGSTACAGCTGISPLYTPGPGATDLGVTASETFGDNSSFSGEIIRDSVSLDGNAVPLALVAITSQHEFFTPAACNFVNVPNTYQGLLGLGGTSLAVARTGSYFDTLESTSTLGDAFAVQVCGEGGRLWLGGYDPAFVTAPPVFTPAVDSPFYAVVLEDIRIGGTSLGVSQATYSETLVDIGTTALVLPNAAFSALAAAVAANPVFRQNFGLASFFSGTNCVLPSQGLSKAQLDAMLPTLTLVVPSPTGKTVTIDLPATDSYLLQQNDTQGNAYYCSGIEPAAGSPTMTIIGANALHTLITIFDRLNNQIGFAPQQGCPALGAATLAARPPSPVAPPPATLPAPPYRHHRG